jgi:hypothetical protein
MTYSNERYRLHGQTPFPDSVWKYTNTVEGIALHALPGLYVSHF